MTTRLCCSSGNISRTILMNYSKVTSGLPQLTPIILPSLITQLKITVPSVESQTSPMLDPKLKWAFEKLDPIWEKIAPKIAPTSELIIIEKLAARKLQIRRRRMRLHKLRKLYRRDHHMLMTNKRTKESDMEKHFGERVNSMIMEAEKFDPKEYVEDIITKVHWKPEPLSESGRKIYPHWTETITMEQLYGLPETDYISKSEGFASDEDWEEIKKLREKYYTEWENVNGTK